VRFFHSWAEERKKDRWQRISLVRAHSVAHLWGHPGTVMISQYQFWVLFERTCVFAWIQFAKHFIELVFVETNELVHSNSNLIMTRQTCGQHSSRVAERVPGLPIRDCSGSCNRSVSRCTNVSEIDVTAKTFFEHLYLDLGLRQFAPWVNSPCAPTPPPFTQQLLSRFPCKIFPRMAP